MPNSYTHSNNPVLQRPIEPAQYTSVKFGETLSLSGLVPSIGSVGDAYDNALAETTIGLYKNEAVRDDSPFRRGSLHRLTDVELLTAEWVHWYNPERLMRRLGRTPPVEYETHYYSTNTAQSEAAHPYIGVHQTQGGSPCIRAFRDGVQLESWIADDEVPYFETGKPARRSIYIIPDCKPNLAFVQWWLYHPSHQGSS